MLAWDLSDTLIARDEAQRRPPNEAELQAILAALLLVDDCAFGELSGRTLALTHNNQEDVARVIEQRLEPLARDIGTGSSLRQRLDELVGLTVTVF